MIYSRVFVQPRPTWPATFLNRQMAFAKLAASRLLIFAIAFSTAFCQAENRAVRIASDPALSPDGKRLIFSYASDIWTVPTAGGLARRISTHPAQESQATISSDGKRLAFISNRSGSDQVWVQSIDTAAMPTNEPVQVTHHSDGFQLHGWYPDNQHVLVSAVRDAYWYARENTRFFRVAVDQRRADELLFDAYGTQPSLSPNGMSVLFQREGVEWWRKGYQGSRAAQIWRYDSNSDKFTELIKQPTGDRSPIWKPDNSGFFFVSQRGGSFNLWEQDFKKKKAVQRTHFQDDTVTMPTLSADGKLIVFRHLFDFYSLKVSDPDAKPRRIKIQVAGDQVKEGTQRRTLSSVTAADTTHDGLEWVVVAGGDLWVTDTELREPINVTKSACQESEPLFIEDGAAILFLRELDGTVNLWRAERTDDQKYWWQQSDFHLRQLTHFPDTISNLQLSPCGCRIAYVRAPGDLYVANLDGGSAELLYGGFSVPSYDFSPDGRWIALAQNDNNFNSDIWIVAVDGSIDPVNVSRHPRNDYSPKWSPDGRILAFTAVRETKNTDLFYVYLKREDADSSSRDRKLEKAITKMQEARKSDSDKDKKAETKSDEQDSEEATKVSQEQRDAPESITKVEIDFEDLHRRVQRIRIDNASVSGLFWFGKDNKLAAQTSIDGNEGTYVVEFPDDRTPKKLVSDRGTFVKRLKDADRVAWISSATPGTLTIDGKLAKFPFSAPQQYIVSERFAAGFVVAWRLMRDHWYDEAFGNRNWAAIRRKYADSAASVVDERAFTTVIQMMLGELNGSHLGFSPSGVNNYKPEGWTPETAHLGVRFEYPQQHQGRKKQPHRGPGLLIRDVLTDGPADRVNSRLHAGETILTIDDVPVDPDIDLTTLLNGSLDRDIRLRVRAKSGSGKKQAESPENQRTVLIRPISQSAARSLLYPMWEQANREAVARLSDGKLGYLHIQGMNMSSLYEFERQLFAAGFDKQGLVIDVRGNGGGSTTDHLLTALTQPRHAITVPRGGGPGYPQDRTVYATWDKPIIVLCNQNSFSNAEIFSHAIRFLKRGQLVGVRTAGGVISTGSATVMDLGTLRRPFRGWFSLETGFDMELNGAVPHVEVWPLPGEMASGKDRALKRAVQLLSKQADRERQRPKPNLIKATDPEHR